MEAEGRWIGKRQEKVDPGRIKLETRWTIELGDGTVQKSARRRHSRARQPVLEVSAGAWHR